MDKIIKINLGGSLFHIDEEAYRMLRRYLQDIDDRLKNTEGGAETIESMSVRLRKRATGRTKPDASRKTREMIYNYSISSDTISIDEYFSLPSGSKWSVNNMDLDLFIPVGTKVHFDKTTLEMFNRRFENRYHGWDYDEDYETVSKYYTWVMTNDGLKKKAEAERRKQ